MNKTMVLGAAVLLAALTPRLAAADPVPLDVTDAAGNKLTGDPARGEVVFKKCSVCHSIKEGENRIGPSLFGVVNRPAGSIPHYSYSTANKTSGIVWTEQKLFAYLEHPQQVVPGTKMSFPGLPKPEDRADVIAYLKKNSK